MAISTPPLFLPITGLTLTLFVSTQKKKKKKRTFFSKETTKYESNSIIRELAFVYFGVRIAYLSLGI